MNVANSSAPRDKMGAVPHTICEPILDEFNEVSDQTLDQLHTWAGTPAAATRRIGLIFDAMGYPDALDVEEDEMSDEFIITITSLDASCDLVTDAVNRSALGVAFWGSSHRDGRHIYHVPLEAWDTSLVPTRLRENQYDAGCADTVADLRPAAEELIAAVESNAGTARVAAAAAALRAALDVAETPSGRPRA